MKITNILCAIGCGLVAQTYAKGMSWEEADQKAQAFVKDLSNQEKIDLVTGSENMQGTCVGQIKANSRKNFKGICLQDGPAGVRFNGGTSTSWQVGMNSAATWNKELLYEVGKGQGEEFYAKGINVPLAPAMNIMRAPTSGRIWESFGEDSFLAGTCGAQVTKGMQDAGVMATPKHFFGNDQEYNREASTSNMDEQTMMEVYVEPFIMTLRDGDPAAFMNAYNAVNGEYTARNKALITDLLKEKLGFKGFIMSDWWAIHDLESFSAGMDMNMPGGKAWGPDYITNSFWGPNIASGIQNGQVKQARLDDAALRIIRAMYKTGQMESFPSVNLKAPSMHLDIHRQAAIESQVLLKNDGNILPIKNVKKIAIIGKDATKTQQCSDSKCASGTVIQGWGSGTTDIPSNLTVPLEEITKRAQKDGITVTKSESDETNAGAQAASGADIALVFVQADSGEEYITVEGHKGDRNDLDLWHNGAKLVEAVAAVNKNVVVVIHAPGPVNLPFLSKVKGVIYAGMPGQEAGTAIAKVLFGDENPSGHLPFTWAPRNDYCCDTKTGSSFPAGGNQKTTYEYSEGLFIGYKWFDKKGIVPTFPFGHGLSYTDFDYSNLSVSLQKQGTDVTGLTATFTVKNTGAVKGAAVPMLFLGLPEVSEMGDYPSRLLKGFDKIVLGAGESKTVTINVDQHAMSYYNKSKKDFVIPTGGDYTVYIGKSAGDIVLKQATTNTQGTNSSGSTGGSTGGDNKCIPTGGYQCCKNTSNIVYTDSDANWGVENNDWCIVNNIISGAVSCFSEPLGYPCCTSTTNVVYTDSDGKWGVENGNWCGL